MRNQRHFKESQSNSMSDKCVSHRHQHRSRIYYTCGMLQECRHPDYPGCIWRTDDSGLSGLDMRSMFRLNSGILRIFELGEWNLNLNSSDCRASKIIYNDIKLEPISWELNLKNRLFNFCAGVCVGGHRPTNFSHISKDAQ